MLLWDAGQEREARQERARLAQTYLGVRDGQVAALVMSGQVTAKGGYRMPSYLAPLEGEAVAATPQSIAAQKATLGRLGRWFPQSVKAH